MAKPSVGSQKNAGRPRHSGATAVQVSESVRHEKHSVTSNQGFKETRAPSEKSGQRKKTAHKPTEVSSRQLIEENHRLASELNRKTQQIYFLNKSLIAQQNYVAQALASIGGATGTKIVSSVLGDVKWLFGRLLKAGPADAYRAWRNFLVLQESGRFDPKFYADQLGSRTFSPAQLLRDYVGSGYRRQLDPSADFSVKKYLDFYPDVRASGVEPLTHFILCGQSERRVALPSESAVSVTGGDAIVRIYQPAAPSKVIEAVSDGPEERSSQDWKVGREPTYNRHQLGLYDVRPEDDVPAEGALGEVFLKKYNLLTKSPDFAGAVAHLNGLKPTSHIVSVEGQKVDVSIVIPIYGQLNYTLNCLHSLILHSTRSSFEILVGDDCSPDESLYWLQKIDCIRLVKHAKNGGFISNCNDTAKLAQGNTLVMLNNDTRVVDGWLDWLVRSFELFPKAGFIGSKLFYPDGSLQEAGGIIWRDGSGWNYGRDDDPNRPRYCYARQVDYVSGCSIAVPTKLWRKFGGFDTHYTPAYCEDVDLCFRLREAGYETWYQPLSRIIHYEGKTSGTDTSHGVKAYQVTNTEKLFKRWEGVLANHRKNGVDPWLERDRNVNKRVLVIDACNPTPKQDAGSVSIINLFRYYQANGYHVAFVPADNFLFQPEEVRSMQAAGVECFYAPFELSMATLLQRYGCFYDIIHVIRGDIAHKNYELIRSFAPKAKTVYQTSDLHFLRMERQAKVENRPELVQAAAEMKTRELAVAKNYEVTVTHSDIEQKILRSELPDVKVVVMPLIEKVISSSAPYSNRKNFMFLGGYGHEPNVDAALWLLDDIWPVLSARIPDAKLLLIGARPPKKILERASNRIIVTGLVDDLAPWFDQTRVFLAALRYGAGAKGKVLSSLAHGVPVVATDIAAEGLPLKDGETVFVANTAEEIVSQALQLYTADAITWSAYSSKANEYIQEHHSFETGVELLKQVIAA